MSTSSFPNLSDIERQLIAAQEAARETARLPIESINRCLRALADETELHLPQLLSANAEDLKRMDPANPKYDRLQLSEERLRAIAADLRKVAGLEAPAGRILSETTRPNGLHLQKVAVPFGVIGIIYEARPNVTFDVFSLCLKSQNACVLKGGSDAEHTNRAIARLIQEVLKRQGLNPNTLALLPSGRHSTEALLHAERYVDLLIPRGSAGLIQYVRREATVPVIETGAGVCHTYFDSEGNLEKGTAIVCNAKTRRVSVCNALDCLLVHRSRLSDLPRLCAPLQEKRVRLYADPEALRVLQNHYPATLLNPATEESYGTEFLSYALAIRTVPSLDEALRHISRYGLKHSECIITENAETAERFLREVDAACVYVNASTAFTDGGQFGLGAEIGISTQKLHARGPMGLEALCTYKWLIRGNGQIRPQS